MNKNAIKKFAIAARTRLIATVSDKAGSLGITKEKINEPSSKGNGFEVYKTPAGTETMLQGTQIEQRRRLVSEINARGFDVVMEEVAYTWFNRICAIRFMEVNDYLPTRVRVLSSLKEGKNEPDLLTEAPNVELDFSDKEREWIITAKAENRLDELFSMLFIKQCNKLSEILPELFEATEDYTEMLLNLSYTNKDDVIRMLVDGVDEKDFNVTTPDENGNPTGQVEIIGWLYQYYNTELKDDTFAQLKKNVKISKERIPAATQLFTPDWIVRYMVENSVGRIWIEHLRAVNPDTDEKTTAESFGWKYYLPEAEQEPEVDAKLAEIRKSYADIKPEDILCIDPCMGSGHIIVAMFDVLIDIYRSVGYGERDAAFEIVGHNLHGLDIDKRAYQLAYFAVMMKGRQYNRRFFRGKEEGQRPQPKVYSFVESNDVNRGQLKYLGEGLSEIEKNNALNQINGLLDTFKDAREYGSILNVANYDWELLRRFVSSAEEQYQMTLDTVDLDITQVTMLKIIDIGEALASKYDVAVTNPPYMRGSGTSSLLQDYMKEYYINSKNDLFAVMIERCDGLCKDQGYRAMITQQSWMFLSGYERLRERIYRYNMLSLLHLGAHAFEEIGGEVVQTVTFITRKISLIYANGIYERLVGFGSQQSKNEAFLDGNNCYCVSNSTFDYIPGKRIVYWLGTDSIWNRNKIGQLFVSGGRNKTHNNEKYVREWWELAQSPDWVLYMNGGNYRKWYGNLKEIVNWSDSAKKEYASHGGLVDEKNVKNYGISWNGICGDLYGFRIKPKGIPFSSSSPTIVCSNNDKIFPVLAFLNTKVSNCILSALNPTLQLNVGEVLETPLELPDDSMVLEKISEECVEMSKEDWDAFEISLDFKRHPMVVAEEILRKESIEALADYLVSDSPMKKPSCRLEACFWVWSGQCWYRYKNLKANEEKLNRIFIDLYGLQDELQPDVEDKDVTVRKADLKRDIQSLISYAVGCMFGRYSPYKEGLIYDGGDWNEMFGDFPIDKLVNVDPERFPHGSAFNEYGNPVTSKGMVYYRNIDQIEDCKEFWGVDADNIIPITDEEYFEDDIVYRFIDFIRITFGEDDLENNLDFIAKALGNKGDSSRDVIRNYFLNDFFKDHCNTYSVTGSGKRPIYWLFDSGKQNGFRALIYLHRYDQDTVGRVRTDYLHKTQKAIEQAMQGAQYTLENSKSGTEKSKATKRISKYTKQLAEIQLYDEAIAHIANKRIPLDLDDGVKVNYAKFQGVEVSQEGMKTVKVDLLAKI